jgi:hypothetical protein
MDRVASGAREAESDTAARADEHLIGEAERIAVALGRMFRGSARWSCTICATRGMRSG